MVAEWEREGKVGRRCLWICKHVTELQRELIFIVKECRRLSHDSSPLFLMRRHHSESWFQALIIQFSLLTKNAGQGDYLSFEVHKPIFNRQYEIEYLLDY